MSLYNKIIDQQKLMEAWKKVHKNKPKEGIDGVTCDEFEINKKDNIKELWNELKEHNYHCLPVKVISIYKGEKVRYISLHCMRDKVIQYSLSKELQKLYNNSLSDYSYAYRSGKSALQASRMIHEQIRKMRNGYVLKADIHSFFDCISHEKLKSILKDRIREADVLKLIYEFMNVATLDKNGELISKSIGIYQGATIAPILSNIYMMEFDHKAELEANFYLRYSDDMIFFFETKKEAEQCEKKIKLFLEELSLELNKEKTRIVSFEEGFEFLGYHYNQNGKAVTKKAELQLAQKLETIWMDAKYKDITTRLEKGREVLTGWEQYFEGKRELLDCHKKYLINNDDESRLELIQLYSDLKMYDKAQRLMRREQTTEISNVSLSQYDKSDIQLNLNEEHINQFIKYFVGREDLYTVDGMNGQGRRKVEEVLNPLLPEVLQKHFSGKETVGTYIQRSNHTVKYLVLDLDISKRILLSNPDEKIMKNYLQKCLQITASILKELRHLGLNGYVEDSGRRGHHIWIFFEEWISVRYANLLSDIIDSKIRKLYGEGEIQIEYFPNKTRLRGGRKGQSIKLPWGIHPITGRRSIFLDDDFQPYHPQENIVNNISVHSLPVLKRLISSHRDGEEKLHESTRKVDCNLDEFGELVDTIKVVLESCNLARYLCQKARTTHYLNHFERLTILYIFGHLGEDGKEFVHQIMSLTLNYSYNITQKFILRCPQKPISCLKLREQYKQISAEIGCSCVFKRTKNCYPSPVLHALKKANDTSQITMPISKTISATKQNQMKEEISISAKLQIMTEKLMELRKQKRGIDKLIQKCEYEISQIFDENHTDSMEIKPGILVRKNNHGVTEWMIEL